MDTIRPTTPGKYSAEDWDDVFTQNSGSKYLNEYHVPDGVMKAAMRYYYFLQNRSTYPGIRRWELKDKREHGQEVDSN